MKYYIPVLFLFCFSITITSRADTQFKEAIGLSNVYDEFNSVCETPDSGYVFFGSSTDSITQISKLFLVRTAADGTVQWSKTYDYPVDVFGIKNVVTGNGDLVLMGYTFENNPPYDDVFIIRTDPDGNILWSKVYGGNDIDEANDLAIDAAGQLVVAGYTYSFGTALKSGFVFETDEQGVLRWSKTYAQNVNQELNGVIATADGGFFMTGWTQAPPGINIDGYLLKTDSLGSIQWSKRFGGTGTDIFYKAWQDSDGKLYACGTSSTNTASGNQDAWLFATDSSGTNNLINVTYGSSSVERAYSIAAHPGSMTLVLSGHSNNNAGFENALYLPVDKTNGNMAGSALLAGSAVGNARAFASIASSTGLVQAGFIFHSADSLGSAYAVKYPTITSPCQVDVSGITPTDQLFGPFADSSGSDSATVSALATTVTFLMHQVPVDQFLFCGNVGMDKTDSENSIELFPNPATDEIRILWHTPDHDPVDLRLVNMQGETVMTMFVKDHDRLSLSGLAAGIYQVIIQSKTIAYHQKVVKLN